LDHKTLTLWSLAGSTVRSIRLSMTATDERSLHDRISVGWPIRGTRHSDCRAGTTTAYSFGDDESKLGQQAWFYRNAWLIHEKYAHQVGFKTPNTFGVYDMHGNVWEWCHDYYEGITTNSHSNRIQRARRPALTVFCGVGRGTTTRVTLVPLTAVGTSLISVTSTTGFG
jgi:hypothetical protein